jgi:hypothetical protein
MTDFVKDHYEDRVPVMLSKHEAYTLRHALYELWEANREVAPEYADHVFAMRDLFEHVVHP